MYDSSYNGGLTFYNTIFYKYNDPSSNTITINNFGSIPINNQGKNFISNVYDTDGTTKLGINYIFPTDEKNLPLILTKGILDESFSNFYFNNNVNDLDTSLIYGLYKVFYESEEFNQPLYKWNLLMHLQHKECLMDVLILIKI